MNVLVVGGGGREHALCWAIYCAPGNAGIAELAECVAVAAEDVAGIVELARERAIDLVVVGPEAPLVAGLVDALETAGIRAFGPRKNAAILEGSKAFMKDLFAKYAIPTAAYRRFTDHAEVADYVRRQGAPIVVKASGLAAGKGVVVARTVEEALVALATIMKDRAFGAAGDEVVVEEFLEGEEASFFALVDGATALPLASAQDHKTAFDNDEGPNTGGMGAYSPAPVVTAAMADEIMRRIIAPTVAAMTAEGRPYKGVLYAGLMITRDGPKVLEYNVRFGDPECQALMVRLQSDILDLIEATIDGRLDRLRPAWSMGTGLVVVMAAKGYPGTYERGSEIRGLAQAGACDGVTVFHAGTRAQGDRIVADGGRVLGIAASGATAGDAQRRAYAAVDLVDWPGGFCRRDIGWRAVARESAQGRKP